MLPNIFYHELVRNLVPSFETPEDDPVDEHI